MRRWIVLMLLLVLTACVPAPSGGGIAGDPASLRATAQAAEALAEQAEQSMRLTQTEMEARARATAAAFQSTQQALNVQATQMAMQATATALAYALEGQAMQATATAQAVERLAREEERQRRRDEIVELLLRLLAVLALGGFMAVLVLLAWKAGNEWILWRSQRWRLVESRAGTLVILPEGAPRMQVTVVRPEAALPGANDGDEFATGLDEIPYRVNDEIVGFVRADWRQPADDPQRRLVLRLLRESIRAAGAQSDRIPGWRELGWSADMWSQAVRLLWRYVETQPGKGTFLVGEYRTLEALYQVAGSRHASLSPAPVEVE